MDLTKAIKEKADVLSSEEVFNGISAAIRHIEMAEWHLDEGKTKNNDDFFNDVIYRTNQAFEGMLKEAYSVLTVKDGKNLSTNTIEKHLLGNNVLSSWVLDQFTNYRQKWRNPSTHDHTLFFNEQEALLAIVSISAFTLILLDQIIERINFNREQEITEGKKYKIIKQKSEFKTLDIKRKLIFLLKTFSRELLLSDIDNNPLKEVEILGKLAGFIKSIDSSIDFVREPVLKSGRPDFIFNKGDEKIIVEIKSNRFRNETLAVQQMVKYLEAAEQDYGIVYIYPTKTGQKIQEKEISHAYGGIVYTIHVVTASWFTS